jgi:hypothetical protein
MQYSTQIDILHTATIAETINYITESVGAEFQLANLIAFGPAGGNSCISIVTHNRAGLESLLIKHHGETDSEFINQQIRAI